MTFDRHIWTRRIYQRSAPPWPCPTCGKGTLALSKDTLVAHETVSSKRSHGDDGWDPDWIDYTFTAWLICSNSACGELVAVAGTGSEECEHDEDGEMSSSPYYMPQYLHPAPDMFQISAKCPKSVTEPLRASFALFWQDSSAAASRLRIAIERTLDSVRVKTRRKTRSGGFERLSLHKRIEEFAGSNRILGAQLMALKWLGNVGSHDAHATRDDLLDAFEIFENVLGELIEERSKRVSQLAKTLHKKHVRRRK